MDSAIERLLDEIRLSSNKLESNAFAYGSEIVVYMPYIIKGFLTAHCDKFMYNVSDRIETVFGKRIIDGYEHLTIVVAIVGHHLTFEPIKIDCTKFLKIEPIIIKHE